jgi:alcohol dehydrogenase class IV
MALINYITQIQFEFGAIGLLRQQCERVGIRRPLIVTDRGVKAAGIIDTVLDALAHAGTVALYDGTPPNPNEAAVRQAVRAYKKAIAMASSPWAAARPSISPKASPSAQHTTARCKALP